MNAMEIMQIIGNRAVEEKFRRATDEIQEGSIAGPIKAEIFPPLLIHMIWWARAP